MKPQMSVLIVLLVGWSCGPREEFAPHKLTRCMVYEISETEPVFTRVLDEGDVAYYGLLLQATGKKELRNYLVAKKRDHLWEYNWDYGVTAEDSAIVLEGLLSAGESRESLLPSADRISREYFVPDTGGFRTVLNERAAYWKGASVITTAHVAWLLHQIAPDRYSVQIASAGKFIQKNQLANGSWKGEWFPSHTIPSYYSIRLLLAQTGNFRNEITKGAQYLRATQTSNGSWANSIIETSAAVLALKISGQDEFSKEIERGRRWLREKTAAPFPGEAVLYYWFERKDSKVREFFHCSDLGEVSQAWAALALHP